MTTTGDQGLRNPLIGNFSQLSCSSKFHKLISTLAFAAKCQPLIIVPLTSGKKPVGPSVVSFGDHWWYFLLPSPSPVLWALMQQQMNPVSFQPLQWESVQVVHQLDSWGRSIVRPLRRAGVPLPLQRGADSRLDIAAVCLAAVLSVRTVPTVAARHGDSEGVRVLQFHLVLLRHPDEGAPGEGVAETSAEPAGCGGCFFVLVCFFLTGFQMMKHPRKWSCLLPLV